MTIKAETLAKLIDGHVRGYVEPIILDIQKRFDEDRSAIKALRESVESLPITILKEIPDVRDGRDADPVTPEQIYDAVEEYLIANPPKDGKDAEPVSKEKIAEAVKDYMFENPVRDGKDGEPGPAGTSVTIDDVLPDLKGQVEKAIAELPVPADGKDGKDGADGTSVTLDDIQPIMDTALAKFELAFERRAQETLQRAIDKMEPPKDGRDGRDALSIDDFDVSVSEDGREVTMRLSNGERTFEKTLRFPVMVYCDTWTEGEKYKVGDVVTHSGSMWVCRKDTTGKPGEYTRDWRLAVRRGRNGKSA